MNPSPSNDENEDFVAVSNLIGAHNALEQVDSITQFLNSELDTAIMPAAYETAVVQSFDNNNNHHVSILLNGNENQQVIPCKSQDILSPEEPNSQSIKPAEKESVNQIQIKDVHSMEECRELMPNDLVYTTLDNVSTVEGDSNFLKTVKQEVLNDIDMKDYCSFTPLHSEQLVYTTLKNGRAVPQISATTASEYSPHDTSVGFSPVTQMVPYSNIPTNFSSSNNYIVNGSGNYTQRPLQTTQAKWMQPKQVLVNTPASYNTAGSMVFDVFPKRECNDLKSSTPLPSTSSSSYSSNYSALNLQKLPSSTEGGWESSNNSSALMLGNNKPVNGSVPYYGPLLNDRENHNMKERERRARVTRACSKMRMIIPGVTETTDKASVFGEAAQYIEFLQLKLGRDYDHIFSERMRCKRLRLGLEDQENNEP